VENFVDNGFCLAFRRTLRGALSAQWGQVIKYIQSLSLSDVSDSISWSLDKKGILSTKYVYKWLEKDLAGANKKCIWEVKISLKINIKIVWQLSRNVLLTTDNMKKRKWVGSLFCYFFK
jgi:hypothetical protein